MTQTEANHLKNGYYKLRSESSVLKDGGRRFEGTRWLIRESCIERYADSWVLRVYNIEGNVEACLISPNGTQRNYC
jgi:hypothetical protein